jgi:hypothetical protein
MPLPALQLGFGVHAAKYRRCTARSLGDLENQLVQRVESLQHAKRSAWLETILSS